MNLILTIQLDNLPDATDIETVHDIIREQLAEWLDFDRHPQDLHISLEKCECQPGDESTL